MVKHSVLHEVALVYAMLQISWQAELVDGTPHGLTEADQAAF
jgi:hypothetical protein